MGTRTAGGTRAAAAEADDLAEVRVGLHQLQRLLAARGATASLVTAAGVDLPQQAVRVLVAVSERPPRSMADIARAAHLDAAVVSRQVRALEDDGLLVRHASAGHGRIVLVEPTARGAAAARAIVGIRDRHLAEALEAWDPDERVQLGRLLVRLAADLRETPYRSD